MATDLPIRFHYEAFSELEQAENWYNEQAERLGETFFQEIQSAAAHIQKPRTHGQNIPKEPAGFSCIGFPMPLCITLPINNSHHGRHAPQTKTRLLEKPTFVETPAPPFLNPSFPQS